jgi:hypothetical protein
MRAGGRHRLTLIPHLLILISFPVSTVLSGVSVQPPILHVMRARLFGFQHSVGSSLFAVTKGELSLVFNTVDLILTFCSIQHYPGMMPVNIGFSGCRLGFSYILDILRRKSGLLFGT